MIKSKYISDILEMLLDGDDDSIALRPQLPYLVEDVFKYTGSGVFVNFKHLSGIEVHKFPFESILNGIIIKSHSLDLEADASLFIKDGIIDYLEIWCHFGDYPKEDLRDYELKQVRTTL